MYARLTTTVIGTEEHEAAAEVVDQILPTLRGLDGFKGIVVISNPEERTVVAMTLWESAESLEASETVMGKIRRAETSARQVDHQETGTFRVVSYHLSET